MKRCAVVGMLALGALVAVGCSDDGEAPAETDGENAMETDEAITTTGVSSTGQSSDPSGGPSSTTAPGSDSDDSGSTSSDDDDEPSLGDCDGLPVLAAGEQGVFVEAEMIEPAGDWTEEQDGQFDGFSGSYFQWIDEKVNEPDEGEPVLEYCFSVETPGTYLLEVHGRRDRDPGTECENSENDGCNDVFVQIDGQGHGDQAWTKKMVSQPWGEWGWDPRWDPQNGSPFRTELELAAGPHVFAMAGRSHRVKVDAIRIYLDGTDPPTP